MTRVNDKGAEEMAHWVRALTALHKVPTKSQMQGATIPGELVTLLASVDSDTHTHAAHTHTQKHTYTLS